jgi:enamine deaminase RidA (YjgF/YER057c/UK114 family)
MKTQFLNPPTVHAPGGAYSHLAVVPGGTELLFISGQVGVRPDGTLPDSLEAQADQVFANLGALLSARGLGPQALVKITIYVVTGNDMQAVRAARNRFVGDHRPASTAVYVPALVDPGWRVEIEAVAAVG